MNIVLTVGCFLLASIGVVQVLEWLIQWISRGTECPGAVQVVPLCADPEELEVQLRHQLLLLRWRGGRVILLDTGLEEEAWEICGRLLGEAEGVDICTPEELIGILGSPMAKEAT